MPSLLGLDVEECSPPPSFKRPQSFHCLIGRCEVIDENRVKEMEDHPLIDVAELNRFRVIRRRAEHITGRYFLMEILQQWTTESLSELCITRDAHRAPLLSGWPDGCPPFISISHTNGVALAAVSTSPVGIDAEPLNVARHPGLKNEIMAKIEVEALGSLADDPQIINRIWTSKEAIQKACGLGMALIPAKIPLVNRERPNQIDEQVTLLDQEAIAHVLSWEDHRSHSPLIVSVAFIQPNSI